MEKYEFILVELDSPVGVSQAQALMDAIRLFDGVKVVVAVDSDMSDDRRGCEEVQEHGSELR